VAAKSPTKSKAPPTKTAAAQPATKSVAAKAPAKVPAAKAAPAPAKAGAVKSSTAPVRTKAVAAAPAKPALPTPKVLPMPMVASPPVPMSVKKDPKLVNNWKTKPVEQLSDAEVIAMPDSEYMNAKQMAFFRHKLVELKDGILANAGQTADNLRDDTVVVPDPADRATIEEEHALELRTRDRERKLLKKIEQSISRIDAGDYGYCDETGEPIGVPRLLARPTATLSLEAQQRRELKQKMFGD
jgi:DnaK suppressor protein